MKNKIKSILAMFMVLTVIMGNVSVFAATDYVKAVRTLSSNVAHIGGDEEIEVTLSVTGVPPVSVVKPNDVILVLDKSGSMQMDPDPARFDAMIESAKEFVDLVNFKEHQVGIVDYSGNGQIGSFDLTTDGQSVKDYIDSIVCGGGTYTHDAIKKATEMLTTNGREDAQPVMILLTDGEPKNEGWAIDAAADAKEKGIVFYTIALLGPDVDPDTSKENVFLKELATTGSHHHFILGSVGLIDVYRAIVKEIGIASAYDVVITETVPEEFEIVKGSYEHNMPQPKVDGNTLTWNMLELKADTLKLSYKVKLKDSVTTPGTYNVTDKVTYKDYAGRNCTYTVSNTPITVKHMAPVINSISPEQGYIQGGEEITISGENFREGATVSFGRVAATDVVVVDSQTITVTAPASVNDRCSVTVTVTNDDAQKATTTYTYVADPIITSIEPAEGPFEGGNSIKINGQYINRTATVTIDGKEAVVKSGTEGRQLVVAVPEATKEGKVDVVVTNPDGTELTVTEGYEYLPKVVIPAPEVTSITPAEVEVGKSILATITGTGFQTGLKVTIGETAATVSSVSGGTTIGIRVPASATVGAVDVVVTNPDGQEVVVTNGFTYTEPPKGPAPEITGITPAEVEVGSTVTAYIEGANFQSGLTVTIGGQDAKVTSFTSSSKVRITVPASNIPGKVDVVVTNPDGEEVVLADGFEYLELAAPEILNLSATSVQVGETVLSYINGTGFQTGVTVTVNGEEAKVINHYSATRMYVRIPASDVAGVVDVVVTNPDGKQGTLANGFEYLPLPEEEAPTVTLLTVTNGELIGNNLLYIEGENFKTGLQVFFGSNEATVINVYSATRMYVRVPAGDATGTVDVTVINPSGKQGSLKDAYTYDEYVPQVTSITATSGELAGGELIYVNGKNFDATATVMFGSEEATVMNRYGTTRIYVKVPVSSAAGTVDVSVINADGSTGTLTDAYTYNAPPAEETPVIGKISASGSTSGAELTSIAANKLFYLHGTNLGNTHLVKIVDADGNEFINAPYRWYTAIKMYVRVPATAAKGTATITIINADGTLESNAVTFTII